MNTQCAEPGCTRSIEGGYALYRVSPKETPFVGKCAEHANNVDPELLKITSVFEDRNQGKT